jgi:hypothetical protein
MKRTVNPNAPAIETLFWWTKRDTRKSHYLVRCRKGVITSACGGISKVDLKKWRVAGLADMAAACQGCRDKVAEKQGGGKGGAS